MKKRKDGRYQSSVTITDPLTNEKKRIYVYGYTEAELIREKERVKRNNHTSFDNITFNLWIDEWLKIRKEEIAPSTYYNYVFLINKYILPNLKNINLSKITPSTIRNILRNISGSRTKQYTYVLLKAILGQAYKDDLIKKNPCIAVNPPKYKAKEKQIISDYEFKKLLQYAELPIRNLFILAYYTGIRRGEISALKWENIDWDTNTIKIATAIKIAAKGNLISTPKTENSTREILVSKNVINVLKQQLLIQKERYLKHGDKLTKNDFIFTSLKDKNYKKMLTPMNITTIFNKIKSLAEIKSNITFHSFRHTHATCLVEANLPIKAIQARLGHATAGFTLTTYAHNTLKMQKEIVGFLDNKAKSMSN